MTNRHIIYNIVLLWSVLLCSCNLGIDPDTADLCILYTTDTHSMICPYDFHHNQEGKTGLCNFATLVNEQRSIYADRCLVFDNGNKLSGGPTAYYYKFADTISEPLCYRAERLIDYNATSLGARDIEIPECLQPQRHSDFRQPPILCANLINRQTGRPIYTPYAVYERDGIHIAVLGMIAPTTGDWIPYEMWNQFETEDMIECAKKWIAIIKEKEKPDLIVGLFSCNKDYVNPNNDYDIDTYKNPAGGLPAAICVPGFDLILLGNSNETAVGTVKNIEGQNVTYLQCGANCEKAGMVRIHFKKNEAGHYSKRLFSTLIDLKQYAPDPVFVNQIQDAQDSIFLWMNRPIGYLKDCLLGNEGMYGPDYYRDLINTVQLWHTKADISFASVIVPRDSIPAGPLTMRNIFDIYPYHHQLQKLTMTGEEVRRFLEWGYGCQFETMKSPDDPLLLLEKDPYGHVLYNIEGQPTLRYNPFYYVSAGGIRYSVDISKPAGERVSILSWTDGSNFDPRGLYRVVVSSEQLRDEGKFISRGLNWDREELALHAIPTSLNSLRKILCDYIQSVDTVRISYRHDWDVVPSHFWTVAKQREQQDLNPIW